MIKGKVVPAPFITTSKKRIQVSTNSEITHGWGQSITDCIPAQRCFMLPVGPKDECISFAFIMVWFCKCLCVKRSLKSMSP